VNLPVNRVAERTPSDSQPARRACVIDDCENFRELLVQLLAGLGIFPGVKTPGYFQHVPTGQTFVRISKNRIAERIEVLSSHQKVTKDPDSIRSRASVHLGGEEFFQVRPSRFRDRFNIREGVRVWEFAGQ
jgi:hypothetical protein